jgi:hypothetical protein
MAYICISCPGGQGECLVGAWRGMVCVGEDFLLFEQVSGSLQDSTSYCFVSSIRDIPQFLR